MRSNEISALKAVKYSTPGGRVGNWALPFGALKTQGWSLGGAEAGLLLLLQTVTNKTTGYLEHVPPIFPGSMTVLSCRNKLYIFMETKEWYRRLAWE